ncbi:unnamed protein product [Rotaria sordida]|uniref:Vacuolar protein sorting-associated protein 13A n=1 Tax=Rotaria sordida TaxID=392033 RepID=A0A814M5G5_9BILA|nr:unnamed protein product [Rotaria sordida]
MHYLQFADLNLPITITIGYLKKLALQIPWKNLYTHPTKLTIDGLYVHVIPKIEIEYNAKQDEKEQHEAKMKEVNKIEKLRKDKEAFEDINNIEKDNDTFSARMKLQIMQNLELLIHNIHIVYEDKTTKPNHPFAFGITLNYITFQTTNKEWIPTIIKENSPVIYKLGELNALSIYWNTNIKSNSNLPRNEIIKNLQTKIAVDTDQVSKDMTYIFRPFNVKTKLIMTMKPRQQKFERPMFYITIDLGHISLNLNRAQYLDILDLLEFQGHITAKLKYIKYRPQKFDKTIEKWIFAYNAILNEKIKPRLECYKWENIKKHLEYCREYRYIYVQELTGKITDEQKQRTEELEKKLDVFNLTYIRQRAQLEARKKKEQKPKTLLENFSNWWNNKSSQTDPELDLEKILSAEEKEKLYETIGYEGEDTSTLTYPKDYVDIDLSIRLIMLDLNIWSKINENDQQFRVISRAALPDTEIIFKRRPTTSSALFLVSLGSFQVFGIATDLKQSELSNDSRPVLIHPIIQSTLSNNQLEQPKLLEVEFETNPLDRDSGYRIKVISQSVEVKYNAPTINKLIECFEQDTQRNLQGVKQAAYTTYTDVKHRSILLMKYNIETTKVLDIHINLQSPFFILPENGVYYDGCPAICLDMGNLILQQNSMINKNDEETMDNYIQFQLELKKFQLLYANKYENWQNARQQETTRLHLIKPITLSINLFKCLYSDNANFPAWKISGQIPLVSVRISDMRLFKIIKHIQSLPFPQSKYRTITDIENETELWMTPTLIDTTQQTLETIENMTPMKKILEKLANENQKIENKFEEQLTQIEANFKLSQIDLLLEEEKEDRDYPFLRISFISIYVQTFIKTFDIEFQASLDDFIIYHEQFITKDNQHLRFLAAQHEENQNIDKINSKKLVSLHILHTSSNNPLFTSSKYDGLENKIRIHFSKLIVTLQLEALLSIMKFQDNFMQKWPTDIFEEQIEKKQLSGKFSQENKRMSTIEKFVKTNNLSLESTLEIEANLEEFHIVIATMDTQMFDVYIHGVKANMHNTSNETFLNLILTDFCMLDPHMDARFRKTSKCKDIELYGSFTCFSAKLDLEKILSAEEKEKLYETIGYEGEDTSTLTYPKDMTASLTMNIEAALYNEHTLAWEPLIEPTLDKNTGHLSPWNITCSITPIYPISDRLESSSTHTQQQQKKISGLNAKQLISIGTQQLLNITITKTGLELIQNLSSLFNDIYNQRLPKNFNENESLLSLVNFTGQDIFIDNLNGLEFTDDITWTSKVMKQNESISLNAPVERLSSTYRLSVMEEQTFKKRQEFSIQFDDHIKLININRTWQRIYDLKPSFILFFPIQLLCDTQIHNNCRRIILSSIIKIYNNTTLPIAILDFNSNTEKSYHRIGINEYYYVPINLFYKSSNLSISIGVDEEIKEAYLENTDQLERNSYSIYIHSTIHLTNLLPIDIQCSINNIEEIYLKSSQLQLITSGGKNSILRFIIPFYNKIKWISDPIDLGIRKRNDPSEQIITFHNATSTDKQQILRMALRVDLFHESYRLSLYAPFWIVNHTNLKLEFQIGNDRILIKNIENSFLVCPEKYTNDTSEKGQIRLYGVTQNDSMKYWSEEFSLHVIKSIGMANCKGPNDKTYMICVDITTSSFGLTKIVTLSPAMVIINQTSIPIEIVETLRGKEQSQWIFVECDEVIPFWPQNAKEGLMRVRYAHNQKTSKAFSMNKKHHTLLYMNDTERLVIFVEVIATDFDGVRVIFSDYKQVDAPVLLINHTDDQLISFVQKDDIKIQYLVPKYFVYYTWMDPLKPREMIITCNDKSKTIELNPHRGDLDINENYHTIKYIVFIDGVQTVLLFSCDEQIIEATLNIPSSTQSICRRLQLGMPNVGLSIVNDIRREELLYMSLKKSKLIWVQLKKSGMKPFSHDIHTQLEELYRINLQLIETNPNDETLRQTKYHMGDYREVTFYENTAKLVNRKGEHKLAKRQSLNGLWIEYTWSMTNAAFYACINHIQIDNQLEYTNFPSILYPILSKTADSDITEKPFIELSIYESKASQSNIMHFQYCKLLIQEFVLQIDQGLILAILAFLRQEKNTTTPMINMDTDLEYTHKSLRAIIKVQTDTPAGETQMYFDNIHLSPLKIHVSFSMHGLKSNDELFAEYPLVRFLLRTLNVGEVKDVILRLGFYERSFDRFTVTKLTNEVSAHYQNQFFKQIHVLILGLDVLGNPLGIIRGIAEGVESLFYEPYKGAIEGPLEFAEGMATGVLTLVGSTAGTAAGAASRITGVIGQSLAKLTFDEEYKASRIRRREPAAHAITDIAAGGKNVVMGFVNGVTGVVKKPVAGAARSGASGFVKGLGKGLIGLVAQPASGIVDFASTSLDVVKRAATQEQIVRRVRYPRHVGRDGLVRPYIPHEAMGLYILNRLEDRRYAKTDTYVAHITCSESPMSWLMATSKRILFVTEISILGTYEVDWTISYVELYEIPTIIRDKNKIQILVKPQNTGGSDGNRPSGKLVKYRNIDEARYFVDKTTNAMHSIGL